MVREPPRKCSFCGQHGHNSRTCNNNNGSKAHCVKLFGVNINDEKDLDLIKKSKSMGNLVAAREKPNDVAAPSDENSGYLSDGLIHNKRRKAAHERKKGTPWSEEEHRTFLMGLKDLGKGDWRGISTKYVPTRTPTQVASHAQKYFLRQNANDRKKRRSSLFDMPYTPDESAASSSRMKSCAENNPQLACSRPRFLPGTNSAEIMQRFPQLCLDTYPVPIRPATTAYSPAPNYHPVPYPYTMGVPANVQAWPVNMLNYGTPSYFYNVPNIPINNANAFGGPVVIHHPPGIPQPRSLTSNPVAVPAGKGDGLLDLTIGLPKTKPSSAPTSPASGAIKVT